jgi:hypothetical protein
LVGDDLAAARFAPCILHVRRLEIAHAIISDFAGTLQGLESIERQFQRDVLTPVKQVEIEIIGLEPLETAFACGDGALARCVLGQNLAVEEDLVTAALDGLSDNLFRTPLSIHLCRVDQNRAEIEA